MSRAALTFSANLGFLWGDDPLPDAIRAAARAGFDAVECHWPYDTPAAEIRTALEETGLPMLGLNTARGDVARGDNGLLAVPNQSYAARRAIDQALDYAASIGAQAVHLMAGRAAGAEAEAAFLQNLAYAVDRAAGRTLLIEPLNPYDAPGYFLRTTDQAAEIIAQIGAPNLRMMFDCYHVARTERDVCAAMDRHWGVIGHIQFASVPDRRAPDQGRLDYRAVFDHIAARGWARPLGAEYKPGGPTEATLGWMDVLRAP